MANYYVEVYDEGTGLYEPLIGFDKDNPKQVVWLSSEVLTQAQALDRYDELSVAYPDRMFRVAKAKSGRRH